MILAHMGGVSTYTGSYLSSITASRSGVSSSAPADNRLFGTFLAAERRFPFPAKLAARLDRVRAR